MSNPVRVLVVDDSAVVRGLLARALESDPEIRLAGTAMHGQAALATLQKTPVDAVVMDVEMPVMDGITALQHIHSSYPGLPVVMASALTQDGAETTVRALSLGAAGCIGKPTAGSASASIELVARELVPLIKVLGQRRQASHPAGSAGGASSAPSPSAASATDRSAARSAGGPLLPRTRRHHTATHTALLIGSSTGGPQALRTVLCGLPQDFPLPILIVQHMPPMFTPMLAKHLQQDTKRPCQEAVHNGPIERGHTYVAPGDYHVEVTRRGDRLVTILTQQPPEHFCRPSVNPLFRSAAEWYAQGVLAVMLTGMGEDGLDGTRAVVQRGGWVIAQDEATSVVWGMPGAITRAGLVDEVLPLPQIANTILQRCLQEAVR